MIKTLILEITSEVFSNFQKQAKSRGESVEKFVLEIILKNVPQDRNNNAKDAQLAEESLARHIGAVKSGNPRSADNEQIDADLAKEHGKDL